MARYGEIYRRAVEPVWDSISIYKGPAVFLRQFNKISGPMGNLYAAHWCQSEVRNGGFHQFFSNSTGVLAPEAVAGFPAIGMSALAEIVERVMQYFGESYPRDQKGRDPKLKLPNGIARKECDPFYKLDDEFFAKIRDFYKMADAYAIKEG